MTYMAARDLAAWRRAQGRGGRAMGDVGSGVTAADLAAQVNRFGPSAPAGYQFVTAPLTPPPAVFGISLMPLGVDLATVALTIYQRRATDAYNQFHDTGSQQAITAANAGFADPVTFVTGHLAEVTQTLQAFADSLGIPAAGDGSAAAGISGGPLLIGAAILALWLLMEKR